MDMFRLAQDSAERRRARVVETIGFLRALWAGSASFEGDWASFEGVSGVSAPHPLCPIHIGANGPKMAELAGRHADGVNFHSWEPDLAGLIELARLASFASGRAAFEVSVESPWEQEWLEPDSPTLHGLTDLGVSEVILRWNSEIGVDAIRRAAQWMG
jgi:alkanesulfonate monooxygenase SsuD/methylene tetrahydromethanopterin reductase-like flavin-dependent oxidoreductase (luciferase family)